LISTKISLEDMPGFEPILWSAKAPTAAEVLKAAELKKQAARQARGPRKDRSKNNASSSSKNSSSRNRTTTKRSKRRRPASGH